MDSKRNQEDLYNIKTYTDEELYDVLDLTKNPTDRELEAKILFFIHKYSSMEAKSSKKLAKFFDDIYNHFFDGDSEDEENNDSDIVEGFDAGGMSYDAALVAGNVELNSMLNNKFQMGNINDINSAALAIKSNEDIAGNIQLNPTKYYIPQQPVEQRSGTSSGVTFIKSLDYASGRLNPLIQQTIKRVISIDSKYRDNKQSLSTDFTFNLSEPLKDVVSLKLYSIQVPYSWYTVNSAFGGNFFYLKGLTPGINNSYHDIMIDISAGNYDAKGLSASINNSITEKKIAYSDVSFGNSSVTINEFASLATATFYLQKKYDENSYYLDFAGCGVSANSAGLQAALGYTNQIYYPNTLVSQDFTQSAITDATFFTTGMYKITNSNNFIHVVIYKGLNEWDHVSNITWDASFDLILNLSTSSANTYYSRADITTSLNSAINSNLQYLSSESGMFDPVFNTNPTNNTLLHYQTPGRYQLKLKPNRGFTRDISNVKIAIKFPQENGVNGVWTGGVASCFGFYNIDGTYWNEMSNIVSQTPTIVNSGSYSIYNGTYISLTCNDANFNLPANNIQINVQANEQGYSLDDYITAINTGISRAGTSIVGSSVINNGAINNSNAYKDDQGNFNLNLIVDQSFNESLYELDFRNSIVRNTLFLNKTITADNMLIIGNTYVTNGVVSFNNGNTILISDTISNNINTITGITGNITTNGNTFISNNNITIKANVLTTSFTSTTINYGNIVTQNNSSSVITGNTNMAIQNQVINIDNNLTTIGNIVLSGSVTINGNLVNDGITFNSGSIYSNGRTEIYGNFQITGLNNVTATISGPVQTTGTVVINTNTQINPYLNNNTTITMSTLVVNGVIITTENLTCTFINNGIKKVIDRIYTVNNTYNLLSIGDGSMGVVGGQILFSNNNSGFNIYFPDNAVNADIINIQVNGTINNINVSNITFFIKKEKITSISGSGIITLNGQITMNSVYTALINDDNSFISVTGAAITIVGGFSYTSNGGQIINIPSGNSTINGTIIFTGKSFIDIISFPTGTIAITGTSYINGQNTVNYNTNINGASTTIQGNVYLTNGSCNTDNNSFVTITQNGSLITTNNSILLNSPTITGNINTSAIVINNGITTVTNYANVVNSPLTITLISGYIINPYTNSSGNVRLAGTSTINKAYMSGDLIASGSISNISGTITTAYDVSINGLGNTIDAMRININGSTSIVGSISNVAKSTTITNGTTTISGNVSINPTTRINLTSGSIAINGNLIINGNAVTIENTPSNIYYLTDLTKIYTSPSIVNKSYSINNGDVIAVIKPKRNTSQGNDNAVVYNIIWNDVSTTFSNVFLYIAAIKNAIVSFKDPLNGFLLFNNTNFIVDTNADKITVSVRMIIKINKRLVSKNYNIQFISPGGVSNSWYNNLNIDLIMNNRLSLSTDYFSSNSNYSNVKIVTGFNDGTVLIKGYAPIAVLNNAITFNSNNNTFYLRAYENGVYSINKENDIAIKIPSTYTNGITINYSLDTVIYAIQTAIKSAVGVASINGSIITTITVTENGVVNRYAKIRCNINRTYNTNDFKLVFYDTTSFVKCYVGASSVQNITWDTTLGWLLGYHDSSSYNFKNYSSIDGYVKVVGDSVIILNLYNYFMICLDDYNSNQINDGLVTVTGRDNNNPLPSYSNRSNYQCDPATGGVVYNSLTSNDSGRLTQNQVYSLTQITNTNQKNNSVDNKIYTSTPSIRNVFGLIPIKPGQNGQTFVEYGGTLQNQDRTYFGPVNISRMSVKLITDRGDVLNLNGANWSFALICEQLSNLKTQSAK